MAERSGRSGFRKHEGFHYRGSAGYRWSFSRSVNNGWNNSYWKQNNQKRWKWKSPVTSKRWNSFGDRSVSSSRAHKSGGFGGFRDLYSCPKVDFKTVQEKFWRPKHSSEAAKVLEVNPNAKINRVLSVELANEAWRESLCFLTDKALFVKWGGAWLAFSKFRDWCNKNWGEGMDLKTLEEYVDSSDFSMVSRLCINWQPIHNLPDTLEIKTGSGFWKQKIILDEEMESCSNYTTKIHPPGFCKKDEKGKVVMQNQLEEEIIRLSKGNLWEQHWNEKDWEIQFSSKCSNASMYDMKMDNFDSQKAAIEDSFVNESHWKLDIDVSPFFE
ncbi:hypothetical protein SUGI_0397040 [Cryptomeria japonica]|nr:hypothetical protein SUGI_0397040 [Cryptomeria japonica]